MAARESDSMRIKYKIHSKGELTGGKSFETYRRWNIIGRSKKISGRMEKK
tara:strand:- start:601 stop:750 length:150 start_codon:yes stop_codon:yes gene_type:complete